MKITDKIKSFEDACKHLELDPANEIPYADPKTDDQKAINAFAKMNIIAKALNEGWVPDWYNWDEYKYYPYFDLSPDDRDPAGGPGFSYCGYYCGSSCSFVGSRLVFRNRELAVYAGKQFLDIYKDFMTSRS